MLQQKIVSSISKDVLAWVGQRRLLHDPKTDAKQHNLDLNISDHIFDTEICQYCSAFATSLFPLLYKLPIRQ
jgi:hypothetical protein